ncbi:class I SAM-dependent methyltransferase [Ktedonosporobacter rubrisoli]|uniref:Class I SAM-dependent methyltransferase n=1 Tax=Ktedonosporobacter rubrisoli TaxID=2509675 RepID=A0A4P6JWW6_KTERU|nr:class I SAM-dependent methyltransferase [Ktedonosporobacter rubrisoli]QBD80217.1 class I SAM-dependent methyltransferase [Ktedonosporobacter rubrisoli]
MTAPDTHRTYWDTKGVSKTFTHPVNFAWLAKAIKPQARILDYGCGYGRVTSLLYEHGYQDVEGVDFSAPMIERARLTHPELNFRLIEPSALPYADASFDAILLFALLTCVPENEAQRALVGELGRILRPGGVLYISDMLLQTDERNLARYQAHQAKYGVYGIFETDDGAICRHHDQEWLTTLLSNFSRQEFAEISVTTMNGHATRAFQWLARKE